MIVQLKIAQSFLRFFAYLVNLHFMVVATKDFMPIHALKVLQLGQNLAEKYAVFNSRPAPRTIYIDYARLPNGSNIP